MRAKRPFRATELRLRDILTASPEDERVAWKLYNLFHDADRLARFREAFPDLGTNAASGDTLSTAQLKWVAAQCHKALDELLGTIGIHAENKEWVLRQLTLQLSGLPVDAAAAQLIAQRVGPREAVLLERDAKRPVHSSEVWGTVVEHTDKAMIVRFDLDGLKEDRAFWWNELKVKREEVPVGTKVVGLARLVLADKTADAADTGEATREVHASVEREIEIMGSKARRPLGHEVSPEDPDQKEAREELKRMLSHPSDKTTGE